MKKTLSLGLAVLAAPVLANVDILTTRNFTIEVTEGASTGCTTPGQECAPGIRFARETGGQFIYATPLRSAAFYHNAVTDCQSLGAGWGLFNRADRAALAVPGDPFNVDMSSPLLWGPASSQSSGGFDPGCNCMVTNYAWSSNAFNIRSQNLDGNFNLYSYFGENLALIALGTNTSNTTPPQNLSESRPYVCSIKTNEPLF
jgi:hypothetical protein